MCIYIIINMTDDIHERYTTAVDSAYIYIYIYIYIRLNDIYKIYIQIIKL